MPKGYWRPKEEREARTGTRRERDARDADVLLGSLGMPVRCACPECGSVGPHDTNGDRLDPSACCAKCGLHFDLVEI